MTVYPCGTNVTLKVFEGVITAFTVRFERVQYEVSYWDAAHEYKSIWIHESEFITGAKKKKIGFI